MHLMPQQLFQDRSGIYQDPPSDGISGSRQHRNKRRRMQIKHPQAALIFQVHLTEIWHHYPQFHGKKWYRLLDRCQRGNLRVQVPAKLDDNGVRIAYQIPHNTLSTLQSIPPVA
jgi:hypothetical protein